jgi:hypothetical protein
VQALKVFSEEQFGDGRLSICPHDRKLNLLIIELKNGY